MQYKTIMLELIKQRPKLHEALRSNGTLLSTMEQWALLLRERHLDLVQQLRQARPTTADVQLKSEAMEMAVREIDEALQAEST